MDIIDKIEHSGYFAAIDRHFAGFLMGLCERPDPVIALSAALASRGTRQGDVCIDLASFAGETLESETGPSEALICPELTVWREHLQDSELVGTPGDYHPLILDDADRLYLYRYWSYENTLITCIQSKIEGDVQDVDAAVLSRHLSTFFPDGQALDVDWQKVAAAVAVRKRFCVISGGPGTGKTYAIARILATLIKQVEPRNLRIVLAAPTGKAAARLADSIRSAKKVMMSESDAEAAIPDNSFTIHRLLKPIPNSPNFRHNQENPLAVDVMVVDEASMVDLPLMSKLMQALPEHARLILIGDRHQLASVEAGSILGDICGNKSDNGFSETFARDLSAVTNTPLEKMTDSAAEVPGIHDGMVYFTRSYRFGGESGISMLSRAVNNGREDQVLDILKTGCYPEIHWYPLSTPQQHQALFSEQIRIHYSRLQTIQDPQESLAMLNRFRILCAVNQGPLGVDTLNALATLSAQQTTRMGTAINQPEWYHGRPVMVTSNDYTLGLFNGDVGIAMWDETAGEQTTHVYFQGGSAGEMQRFSPARLPRHQAVYAMTIHKSQGSEFDDVLLVLPELDSPLLTRELLYTGMTRARRNLSILASESVIKGAVSKRIERTSGLRDALWVC